MQVRPCPRKKGATDLLLPTHALSSGPCVLFIQEAVDCRHARLWGSVRITWDSWAVEAAQAGVYRGDELRHAVERPEAALQELQQRRTPNAGNAAPQPSGLAPQPIVTPNTSSKADAHECTDSRPAAQQQADVGVSAPVTAALAGDAQEAAAGAAERQQDPTLAGRPVLTRCSVLP